MKEIRIVQNPIVTLVNNHLVDYPSPKNLNYYWSFGSLAGMCLVFQICTGFLLTMHYIPHVDFAFSSVKHIMEEVNNGWLLRYLHANGASFFFILVYCHIYRGFFYGSYIQPRAKIWASGVIIFLLMMATAFMGYVLPWGQMSFWGATVITNLFSAIPFIGQSVVEWLWGGFSVGNATLNRFFALHYLLPFIIVVFVLLHLFLLHNEGSNNPVGTNTNFDSGSFHPYFSIKDTFAFFIFLSVWFSVCIFFPNVLNHPDNYIPANAMVTPSHIVPEWYFLPFYAILRSIPDKLGGVIAMVSAILVLFILPVLNDTVIRNTSDRSLYKYFVGALVIDFIILGWLGQQPVETPYIEYGIFATFYYFFFMLVLVPFFSCLEQDTININKN